MDETQKVLINAGRKDLAQEYYKKISVKKVSTIDSGTVRYIPSGAKVITELSPTKNPKKLKIIIIDALSAPPLTTKDIKNIEDRMMHNVDLFIKDVKNEIDVSVDREKYIFMEGKEKKIYFTYGFSFSISDIKESKKLEELDNSLDFYKKRNQPM